MRYPGSIGHGWVKQLWLDRDFSGDNERIAPELVGFIPARAGENVHLTEEYWQTLNSLPDAMRKAMLEGLWDTFQGQVFSEWRPAYHVIEPFQIPADWARWTATDYGFVAPFCTLWFARSPDKSRLVVYREAYEAGLRAAQQAGAIKARSTDEEIRLHVGDRFAP